MATEISLFRSYLSTFGNSVRTRRNFVCSRFHHRVDPPEPQERSRQKNHKFLAKSCLKCRAQGLVCQADIPSSPSHRQASSYTYPERKQAAAEGFCERGTLV